MNTRRIIDISLLAVLVIALESCAPSASKYPAKPITLVVHAAAGGGSDIFARTMAAAVEKDKLSPQPIIVENRPGGSGMVAFEYVAGKKGDPYFMLTAVASFLATPLQAKSSVTYKDFTPIANLAFDEFMIIAKADSNFKSMKDLADYARANPRTVKAGGALQGSGDSMCVYLIEKETGIKFTYSSFNSAAEVNSGLLNGSIDFASTNPGEALELVKAGKVRILGVLSEKRVAGAPDVPTLKEQGINTVYVQNRGLVAPAGISADDRQALQSLVLRYAQSDGFKKYIKDNMLTEAWMDGQTFAKWLDEWNLKYTAVLTDMGVIK